VIEWKYIIPAFFLSIYLIFEILFKKPEKGIEYTEYEKMDMLSHDIYIINFYNENKILAIFLFILFYIFIFFIFTFFYPYI